MTAPGKLFLFFDTETNAIGRLTPPVTQTLMQLAWVVTDEAGAIQQTRNTLVKGAKRTGPFCPHSLTPEQVNEDGVDPHHAVKEFTDVAKRVAESGGRLVAHNAEFDVSVLECAGAVEFPHEVKGAVFCTMKSPEVMRHCNLTNRRGGLKWPKLSELYTVMFGDSPGETLHDALGDTQVLRKSFHELKQKGIISFPDPDPTLMCGVYIMAGDLSVFGRGLASAHTAEIAGRTLAYFGKTFGVACSTSFLDLPASNDPVELGKREREMHTAIDRKDIDPDVTREAKRLVSTRLKRAPLYVMPSPLNYTPGSTMKCMRGGVTDEGASWGISGYVPEVSDGTLTESGTDHDSPRIEAHMRISGATRYILKNPTRDTYITYQRKDPVWADAMDTASTFFKHIHTLTSDEALMKRWNTRDPVTRRNIWADVVQKKNV